MSPRDARKCLTETDLRRGWHTDSCGRVRWERRSVWLSPFVCLFCQDVRSVSSVRMTSVCLCVCMHLCLSVCLCVYLCVCLGLYTQLSVCLSMCGCVRSSVRHSVCFCLSACICIVIISCLSFSSRTTPCHFELHHSDLLYMCEAGVSVYVCLPQGPSLVRHVCKAVWCVPLFCHRLFCSVGTEPWGEWSCGERG